MTRVLVVAPTQAIRLGLRAMLGQGEQPWIVDEAASLAQIEESPSEVDLVIYVPSLESQGLTLEDLQQAFQEEEAFPALLLLTEDKQAARHLSNLQLRAWGVLPLDATAEELLAAVQALNEGLLAGTPELMRSGLITAYREQALEGELPDNALTPREMEVLQLLAQGLANKQIAKAMGISEHTVKFHISSIYSKLGAASRTEAIRLGARRGLILL